MQSSASAEASNHKALLERFTSKRYLYYKLIDAFNDLPEGACPKSFIIGFLRTRYIHIFKSYEPALENMLATIDSLNCTDLRELALEAASITRTQMLSSIPPEVVFARYIEQDRLDRDAFIRSHGFTPLNEVFSFDVYAGEARLHFAPARSIDSHTIWKYFVNGMLDLALSLRSRNDVVAVTATSWMIARAPRLIQRLGFTLEGEISHEKKREWFPREVRPVHKASMPIKEFLDRHLPKSAQ